MARALDRDSPASTSEQWAAKATDTVDLVVDAVHDRVVRPALLVGRGIVFGIIIAFIGVVVLILLPVALIRLLDVYVFPGRVWASYAVVATLWLGAGFGLWTQRGDTGD
jgi:hypothetical protein